ncbi:MAG TPA: arginine decarboxylase, partial [Chroococcidiopsis sp.]
RQAFFAATEVVPIAQSCDRIAAELICPYPPGIPLIMPGDRITAETLSTLQHLQAAGAVLTGCSDPTLHTLKVVRESNRVEG